MKILKFLGIQPRFISCPPLFSFCLETNDFKEHVDQQFAKARAGKLFLIVLATRKEAFVYRAVIFNQTITKCQVKIS